MSNKKGSDISGGTVAVGVIIMAVVFACIGGAVSGSSSSKKSSSSSYSAPSYSTPKYETPKYEEPKSNPVTWHCVDATSYNRNAYDDNKCTSSTGEVRYVSDSQAVALDPTYSPGKSGAYYYNNK